MSEAAEGGEESSSNSGTAAGGLSSGQEKRNGIVGAAPTLMASLPAIPGHEGFVQPSSYLRRSRAHSRPMTPAVQETAVDRDQRIGLVS